MTYNVFGGTLNFAEFNAVSRAEDVFVQISLQRPVRRLQSINQSFNLYEGRSKSS